MVPMVIVVRVGLGLAYQGASSTPHHRDPPLSALSSRIPNSGQLSTFQAASHHNNNNNSDTDLHNHHHTSLVTSSSGTKLDTGTREGTESKVMTDDDDNVHMDRTRNSGERNGEKERGEDNENVKVSESAGGVITMP